MTQNAAVAIAVISTLAEVAAAGSNGTFVNPKLKALRAWKQAGFVEVNEEVKGPAGELAVRITEKGEASLSQSVEAPSIAKPAFEIEAGLTIPPISRVGGGAGRPSVYPFDKLELGQSFFVADSQVSSKSGTAIKALASTVAGANNRWSEPTGQKRMNRKGVEVDETRAIRKFAVRVAEKDSAKGARVWRIL